MPSRASVRKATIRRSVLLRRKRLDPSVRLEKAQEIARLVLDLPEVAGAASVLVFASIHSEVPTAPLMQGLLDRGATLLFPFVDDDGLLRAAPASGTDDLEPGYAGIPEPRDRTPVDPAAIGVIVTPGVAFDDRGGRLGYGGGFYDAFLRDAPGVTRVGICFDLQVIEEVPVEEHDERVDVVVTESRVLRRPGSV